VVQHTHLELLGNLSYEILKKNKHNSRINVSDNYKIVINSAGVCVGLKNSVQKLVAKTYLFLSRKIIYADLAEMEKHFYKKIYIINL
jgi:hypothetical protein